MDGAAVLPEAVELRVPGQVRLRLPRQPVGLVVVVRWPPVARSPEGPRREPSARAAPRLQVQARKRCESERRQDRPAPRSAAVGARPATRTHAPATRARHATRSSNSSPADAYRSSRLLARQRRTMRSRSLGTSFLRDCSGGGASRRMAVSRESLRVPLERAPPGQHLVEDRPQGEDVGPRVHRFAVGLLGRHVGHGSQEDALPGQGSERPGRRHPRFRSAPA